MPAIEVRPLDQGFGAEITGLDLSQPLTAAAFDIWNNAFREHAVVILRGQHFNEEQHVAFSEKFGPLEVFVDPKDQARGYPTILRVTNIDQDTNELKPVDDLGHKSFTLGTSDWHTDSSFKRVMSKASLLYGIEIPKRGGDTAFANTAMAFAALPEARQQELEKVVVIHDFEATRRRFGLPPRNEAIRSKNPPVPQPLVSRLPDGRKALLMGLHVSHVDGMPREEGDALIAGLTKFATQPQFCYRHKWRKGDLVMWDNRCTLHRAMPYELDGERRLLQRTTIAGEGPLI